LMVMILWIPILISGMTREWYMGAIMMMLKSH